MDYFYFNSEYINWIFHKQWYDTKIQGQLESGKVNEENWQ